MILRRWAIAALLLAVPLTTAVRSIQAAPAGDPRLVGAWHTVSVDGDALFFIVHGAELDFSKDGQFTARIRFTDGETETKKGVFKIDGDHIELSIPAMKAKESATYTIQGNDLVFHDKSFGITIKISKGKAQDDSGHDLF
ncbi:MAG: hypothetical protein P8R42_27155 [Candidatus Binatia bacterium]|nr:hypothetical protein [Candidatus Binatia bacterium]